MGPGLHGETHEQIQEIENDAQAGDAQPPPPEENINKRKTKENLTASVWAHFKRGVVQDDGSYTATCMYCGLVYPMGNQRGTGNMRNHIKRGYKKIPPSKRHKPDALQKLLQAGRVQGGQPTIAPWVFDQKRCRKSFAKCVVAHEYPFSCANHHFLKAISRYVVLDSNFALYPNDQDWEHVEALAGNVVLAIACVLDPRFKLDVVEYYFKMLHPEECPRFMQNLKACLNQLFKEYLDANSKDTHNQANTSTASSAQMRASDISDTRAGLKSFLSGKRNAEPTKTELEEYLSDALDGTSLDVDFDILAWWKLKAPKYPVMALLTRDILAVPISTVASESTFSTAGRTLKTGGYFGDVVWSSEPSDDTICGSASGSQP
ncbi:hypothetical protein LUZ63_000295 [Rhynchospora breviuscula]|uniref:BED-type domain-containing protein n=1 Tax=Rhynchospora breviuscula TaxID=2022672 RepID=A0A9Q0CUX3_9POAL|nr:hypothetical protein LUZ63_000295 [Rhynchospora breviuscula]